VYLNLQRCPIRSRITYNKKRIEFSTRQFISPSNWLSKQQDIKPDEPDANLIETQLKLIKTNLSQAERIPISDLKRNF